MPHFRAALAGGDPRPITADVVRELCGEVTRPSHFFVAPPLRLERQHHAAEELFWEIYHGRLLDGAQTRQRRQFEAWAVYAIEPDGLRPAEPIVGVRFDAVEGRVYVTRAILCHVHEVYGASGVILSREVQKWQRELAGTIVLDQLADAGTLRDELACLLFQTVVGTSRLPLTSIEAPLPGFAFGQFGYFFPPAPDDGGPRTHWSQLAAASHNALAEIERVKRLELLLRATPAAELGDMADHLSATAPELLALLRAVFNGVSLSPYTDFIAKTFAFVRRLTERGKLAIEGRVDFLCHLIRQIARHLAAYDLVTFHHRGANYPDALLLDELMADLLPLALLHPKLFAGPDREPRLRRRAVRHGLLLQLEYAGHAVPDQPTSPGENLRVLPAPFERVSDDQIYSPITRQRRLFERACIPNVELARACLRDLDDPVELQELGTALFLDRPFGFAKPAGEPDQTLLLSHVLFSRSLARSRLDFLPRRPEWLPDAGAVDRWQGQLRALAVDGLALENAGPPLRPGVVSLHDALRVADDWLMLRTTRQSLRDFQDQYDLEGLARTSSEGIPSAADWQLLAPGGTEGEPTLCLYDRHFRKRLELAADLRRGYASRGGMEFPAAGLRRAGGAPSEAGSLSDRSS